MKDYDAQINVSKYILILAWIIAAIFCFTEIFIYSSNLNMFGRFGSILTLCALTLEFNLFQKLSIRFPERKNGEPTVGDVGMAMKKANPSKTDTKLQILAHASVLLGTVIWGYGDLINNPLIRATFSNFFSC